MTTMSVASARSPRDVARSPRDMNESTPSTSSHSLGLKIPSHIMSNTNRSSSPVLAFGKGPPRNYMSPRSPANRLSADVDAMTCESKTFNFNEIYDLESESGNNSARSPVTVARASPRPVAIVTEQFEKRKQQRAMTKEKVEVKLQEMKKAQEDRKKREKALREEKSAEKAHLATVKIGEEAKKSVTGNDLKMKKASIEEQWLAKTAKTKFEEHLKVVKAKEDRMQVIYKVQDVKEKFDKSSSPRKEKHNEGCEKSSLQVKLKLDSLSSDSFKQHTDDESSTTLKESANDSTLIRSSSDKSYIKSDPSTQEKQRIKEQHFLDNVRRQQELKSGVSRAPNDADKLDFFQACGNGDVNFLRSIMAAKDIVIDEWCDDVSGHKLSSYSFHMSRFN